MKNLLAYMLLLLVANRAGAAEGGVPTAIGAPAAQAHQFDFLIGNWQLEVHPKVNSLVAMIHGSPHLVGSWKGWKAFDGLGIEDEMRIIDASGNPVSLSHSMRVYSKNDGHWNIAGLDAYRAHFSEATAQWKDNEMQVNGHGSDAEGKPYVSRTRYIDISADGFTMQQDRSVDNGQTWDEAVLTVDAKRAPATAP